MERCSVAGKLQGNFDGFAVVARFTGGIATSIAEVPAGNSVLAYPNPCTTNCWIDHRNGSIVDRIVVYDAEGREVGSYAPRRQGPYRMPPQKPGLYCAQVWSGGSVKVVRLVVE